MPAWARVLVRLVMAVWLRKIEVVGAALVPRGVPVIVIGNHENGLIDPMLVAACLPIAPRFVAKSTLWKNPLLRVLFRLARVIPVHRKQDVEEGADPAKNRAMFEAAANVLARGGSISIFPEGQSHSEPQLQPLKTGAARMALAGPPELKIVPVGLQFDRKDQFRSRALLVVGSPIEAGEARAMAATDERAAVRMLTGRMAEALKAVTLNVPTWEERKLLERAVEISRTEEDALEARTALLRTFHEAYRWLLRIRPAEVESVRRDVVRYERTLKLLGLSDARVRTRYSAGSVVRWSLQFVRLVVMRAPLGIVGTALHALPYRVPKWVARRMAQEPDQPASWKLFAAIVVFPLWWAALAGIAALWLGWEGGLAAIILGPLSGWIATQWLESGVTLMEHAKAFLLLPFRRRLLEELRGRRERIVEGIARLEAVWRAREDQGAATPPPADDDRTATR